MILCIALSSGCKKSCYTCFGGPFVYLPIKYDSSFNISYDSVSHQYDTVLVKIDTIERTSNSTINHICPGNPEYQQIMDNNTGGWYCTLDQ